MLKNEDLDSFIELVNQATQNRESDSFRHPDDILQGASDSNHLLHRNELGQLKSSLKIASFAGDVDACVPQIMYTITENLSSTNICYLPLSRSEEWIQAIRWAIATPSINHFKSLPHEGSGREFVVGNACRSLRDKGYDVEIDAQGPRIDGETRTRIGKRVNELVCQVGGREAIGHLCHFVAHTGRMYEGVWLLGNFHASRDEEPSPAVPIGWLLGVALSHIHCPRTRSDSAQAWKTAEELASELAITANCQHYNPYDGLSLDVRDFLREFENSLAWRELFMLPQVPALVLPIFREAFNQIDWPENTSVLSRNVGGLLRELYRLLECVNERQRLELTHTEASNCFPLLWEYSRGKHGCVNAHYCDPFDTKQRNCEEFVFFDSVNDTVVVLPSPLTAANGLTAIFTRIWKKAGQTTGAKIVGRVIEKAIVVACKAHSTQVFEQLKYEAGGKEFEVDVVVSEGRELVLFESKAKVLTRKSRTGDIVAFINDYNKSFLALLELLVRHDKHIKCDRTGLTKDAEDAKAVRVRKVAVSLLSYGPVADNVLLNSLTIAITRARLNSADGNSAAVKVFDEFNEKVAQILEDILEIVPNLNGDIDMHGFLMDVCWFDLGQLLYALHRGRSVVKGVTALQHLTFSTRDYWTEAAWADKRGHTKPNWHPLEE